MRLGYDPKYQKVTLIASPEELEALAQKMREKAVGTSGVDSTIVATLSLVTIVAIVPPDDSTTQSPTEN